MIFHPAIDNAVRRHLLESRPRSDFRLVVDVDSMEYSCVRYQCNICQLNRPYMAADSRLYCNETGS